MKTDHSGGIEAMKICLIRILLLLAAIVILSSVLTKMAIGSIPLKGILTTVAVMVVPFVPTVIFSYLAGCCEAGSVERLEVRLFMAVYIAVCLLFLIHVFGVSFQNLPTDGEGFVTRSLTAEVDITPICWILLILPACTAVDSIAEYRLSTKR